MDSQYKHTLVNTRQKYSVPGPGFIWHVDTYHKLGNFGFVVFGVIDGFSHECICLEVGIDNLAYTALEALFPKFTSYGIPKFIRGDAGGENIAIGKFINDVRGLNSFLIGKSVNNQRIERFWKDLRTQVASKYYDFFHDLLHHNPNLCDSRRNIWVLQHMFLPKIRKEVDQFRNAWNFHKMKSSDFGKLISPNAQTILGQRQFYIPVDNDLRDRCLNVMKSLEEEYEGRRVQRAQSPFTSPEAEQIFIKSCIPIHDDEDDTNAYFDKIGDAFTIAKSL